MACLQEVAREVRAIPDDDRRTDLLAEGLCIATYLAWLAWAGGRMDAADRAREHFADLRAEVLAAGDRDTVSSRQCRALVLMNDGFPARAADVIGPARLESPEMATLLVRGDDVTRLQGLRGLVRGTPPTTFLPAVFDYTQALINVGGVHEAQQVLATGGWDPEEPLLIELHGSIHERLGHWPEAFTTYRRSPWPAHRYRAAVIGTIIGQWSGTAALVIDEPLRELLASLDGDLDQAEMARSTAFLNACLWRRVESWMVELELGKMAFRRRQFAEADVHLLRALGSAPEEARAPIARTRFSNLTWLTGDQPQLLLSLFPEAYSAGAEAIRLGGDAAATAGVRVWLARESKDLGWLPESLDDWTVHERVEAYDLIDDTARTVDLLTENLAGEFYHRSASRLMRHLHAAGLIRSALWLADVIFRESHSIFLALWETCQDLQQFQLHAAGDTDDLDPTGGDLLQLLDRYRERLVELSQFDFMNAVRTHVVAREMGYEEQAEELLLRAARQAEGVSELVAVAVLRRMGPARGVHSDQEALRCLIRARAAARDRRERLEIARELCYLGAVPAGRAILHAEQALSADTALTHSEMTVALQCADWCTDEERAGLALRAGRRLSADAEAGRLGPYPWAYRERLETTLLNHLPSMLRGVQEILDPRLTESSTSLRWSGESSMAWPAIQAELDPLLDADEGSDIGAQLDALCGRMSFGLRVKAITYLRTIVVGLQKDIRGVAPQLSAHRIPIARWYDVVEGPRVIELRELWRSRLIDGPRAAAALREFHATEQALTEAWEQQRRTDGAPILRRIVAAADALRHVLGRLLDDTKPATHPVLRELFTHMERDVAALAADAAEQPAAARRALSAPGTGS